MESCRILNDRIWPKAEIKCVEIKAESISALHHIAELEAEQAAKLFESNPILPDEGIPAG